MRVKSMKIFWAFLGMFCFSLGTVGIALPILPTVPFYMAAAFCFAKGSKRLHDWFIKTNLYKKYLESYVNENAMTMQTKIRIFLMVTFVMLFGFIMMKRVLIGRIILAIVWLGHLLFLGFRVKTIKRKGEDYDKN